jgi:hypothetical protein
MIGRRSATSAVLLLAYVSGVVCFGPNAVQGGWQMAGQALPVYCTTAVQDKQLDLVLPANFSPPVFSVASRGYYDSTSILGVCGDHPWNGERRGARLVS